MCPLGTRRRKVITLPQLPGSALLPERREGFMRIATFAFCVLAFASVVSAQNDRGTITGEVKDQGGSVVPNATVIATNKGSGEQSKTLTTGTGNYTIASLAAGIYTLSVEVPGFKKFVQENIQV